MARAKSKTITLRHSEYEGLHFGGSDDIVFGLKGGNAPFEWTGPADHPLLDDLWAAEGTFLTVVDHSGPPKIYVSPIDPEREFKSREAVIAHVRELAEQGSAMAQMWLKQNKVAEDAAAAAAAEADDED